MNASQLGADLRNKAATLAACAHTLRHGPMEQINAALSDVDETIVALVDIAAQQDRDAAAHEGARLALQDARANLQALAKAGAPASSGGDSTTTEGAEAPTNASAPGPRIGPTFEHVRKLEACIRRFVAANVAVGPDEWTDEQGAAYGDAMGLLEDFDLPEGR